MVSARLLLTTLVHSDALVVFVCIPLFARQVWGGELAGGTVLGLGHGSLPGARSGPALGGERVPS